MRSEPPADPAQTPIPHATMHTFTVRQAVFAGLPDLAGLFDDYRQGVASALLEAVQAYAWSLGACRVSLNVTRSNRSAQQLYEARAWVGDSQFQMYHCHRPSS